MSQTMTQTPSLVGRVAAWVRQNSRQAAIEIVVNVALPFLVYRICHPALGDVKALMASSAPPIGWSIAAFVRQRRVDALSLIVLAGIAFSLIAFAGGGGARSLQLREHLVAGVIGLIFLGSIAIGRPLIHVLARARMRRVGGPEAGAFDSLRDHPIFRRATLTMTLAWGFGLIAESALSCALVFLLSIQQFMLVSGVVGYGSIGVLTAWTFWYARRRAIAARQALDAGGANAGQAGS